MINIRYAIVKSNNPYSKNTHAISKTSIAFGYKHFSDKRHVVPVTQEGMARLWIALSKEEP